MIHYNEVALYKIKGSIIQLLLVVVFLIRQSFTTGFNDAEIDAVAVRDNADLQEPMSEGTACTNTSEYYLTFYPEHIEGLNYGDIRQIYVNITKKNECVSEDFDVFDLPKLKVTTHDDNVAHVISVTAPVDNASFYTLTVQGVFLGRTYLEVTYENQYNNTSADGATHLNSNINFIPISPNSYMQSHRDIQAIANQYSEGIFYYEVAVIREEGFLDQLFIVLVSLVVVVTNMGMGCKIDMNVVIEVLKKPIAPLIGFTCQFIIMPLVAYCLVVFFNMPLGQALGFFATGCSPGGGASNMYAYILGGDVSLSVTMTLLSTAASFAMIPLWLYTLGTHFIDEKTNISIPFKNIMVSLAGIIVPVSIGIMIQRKKPEWAKSLRKCLKPLFIFLIIFLFTFGMWVNSYLFGLFNVNMAVASCLLPYTGFLLAGGTALACRQPLYRIITIIIETGIQNTGIPILLMKFSLPQPEADMSVVAPVMIAFFTPFPLWIWISIKELQRKYCGIKDGTTDDNDVERNKATGATGQSSSTGLTTAENVTAFHPKVFTDLEENPQSASLNTTLDVREMGDESLDTSTKDNMHQSRGMQLSVSGL